MLIREQGRLIKVMRANSPDGERGGVGSRPRARTRHVVLGVFHADGEVPAALTAALAPDERRILSRWLDAYRRSQPATSMPPTPTGDVEDLDTLFARLGAVADSVCAADGEALRSRLQRIKDDLTRPACDSSCRDGRQRPFAGSLIGSAEGASPVGNNVSATPS